MTNMGIGSTYSLNWQDPLQWKYKRALLGTVKPNKAIISHGANELGAVLATYLSQMRVIMDNLRADGVQKIYLGTIIPYASAGTGNEPPRQAKNRALRNCPFGAAGVIDFDEAIRVQAAPSTASSDFLTTYPHPDLAGYQLMAERAAVNF